MRANLPVTHKEVKLTDQDYIVSTTPPKGVITSINECFCRVSGFSEEELIGQAHNIVRHPDMPEAAFNIMWKRLKAGRSWMGIVKNRCKNGDFYWVNAFVTPLKEDGEIVGHESVRIKATEDQIRRAEFIYERINNNRSPFRTSTQLIEVLGVPTLVTMALVILMMWLIFASEASSILQFALGASAALIGILALWSARHSVRRSITAATDVFDDPVARYVY